MCIRLKAALFSPGLAGDEEVVSVDAGYKSICGVRTDVSLACWGEQALGVTQADFLVTPMTWPGSAGY